MSKCVILLSGGLDSCVAAAEIIAYGYEIVEAVSVFYGQKHSRERACSKGIAEHYGLRCHEATLPPLEGSALTEPGRPVPTDGQTTGVAPTFVPARNALLICYAANRAMLHGATAVVTGVNAVDYSGYPDCRPGFIGAMEATLRLALDCPSFEVIAPLLRDSKEAIVRKAFRLNALVGRTWSCYQGGARPCGVCDSCRIRAAGFAAAGFTDPALEAIC